MSESLIVVRTRAEIAQKVRNDIASCHRAKDLALAEGNLPTADFYLAKLDGLNRWLVEVER